ncbi:MAG: hypothetical protein JWR23_3259 [Mucilaginibacter sp.]|nr:hypothetical protein [Mucilaginibacter sp.]
MYVIDFQYIEILKKSQYGILKTKKRVRKLTRLNYYDMIISNQPQNAALTHRLLHWYGYQ